MDEDDDLKEEEAEDQPMNKQPRITPLLPYMWKKGQGGNTEEDSPKTRMGG